MTGRSERCNFMLLQQSPLSPLISMMERQRFYFLFSFFFFIIFIGNLNWPLCDIISICNELKVNITKHRSGQCPINSLIHCSFFIDNCFWFKHNISNLGAGGGGLVNHLKPSAQLVLYFLTLWRQKAVDFIQQDFKGPTANINKYFCQSIINK